MGAPRHPSSDGGPPLFGRRTEAAALKRVVAAARHDCRLAVVEGEAGIGKSRLIETVTQSARGAGVEVVTTRAEELESHIPFAPIVEAVGRERLTDRLGAWQVRPDLAAGREYRVAELLVECLDPLFARGPVLLVVEDLHWADVGTIGVLARLRAEIDQLPLALVVSARPLPRCPELERLLTVFAAQGSTSVRLGPLDEGSAHRLVEFLVGGRPGPRLARRTAAAGGNPLLVEELVRALLDEGVIVRDAGRAELTPSATEVALPVPILHRLSLVPADVLDLLALASVLGSRFTADDLALLAHRPVSTLVGQLQAARVAGVLAESGDQLAFRHELIREALYTDLPLTVRRGLHQQLAAALTDAGEATSRVAGHLVRGAAPGDERAVAAIVAAARDVVGHAPGLAVDLFRQAIDLSADPAATHDDLLPELAQAMVAAGLFGPGEEACQEALGRDPDGEWAGRLRLQLMFLMLRQGRVTDAIAEGERGLAGHRLSRGDGDRMRSVVAMAHVFSGATAAAVTEARAVLDSSEDEVARALATNALAWAAAGRGAFTEAAELIEPSVRWADHERSHAAHDARPHMIYSLMLIRLDRLDEAQATIQRGRHAAEQLGIIDALPVFHYQQALLDYSCGRLEDASAELDTRARLAEEPRVGWDMAAESLRALIALHRDDLLAAERHVAAAERESAAGDSYGADLMALAKARLLDAGGDPDAALDTIAGFVDSMMALGVETVLPVLGPELARLAARTGAGERAAGVLAPLQRIAQRNPMGRSLRAYVLQTRGLLAADADSVGAAAELLRDAGLLLEAARATEDAAELSRGGGGRCDRLLEDARAMYARCGARRGVAQVEATLRGRGVRHGVRGPRHRPATGWDALTATELRVVRLVAERLTNHEIAQRMFLSRRTVQTHVSHALAKLGASSRRELAAEAARRAGWQLRVEDVDRQDG